VPSTDKEEAVFIFDSSVTNSGLYGREIFNQILPLLEPRSTQSILVGDLLSDDQHFIYEILRELNVAKITPIRNKSLIYSLF
jgi:DNA-binding ferritin-like protein (Dps family)